MSRNNAQYAEKLNILTDVVVTDDFVKLTLEYSSVKLNEKKLAYLLADVATVAKKLVNDDDRKLLNIVINHILAIAEAKVDGEEIVKETPDEPLDLSDIPF